MFTRFDQFDRPFAMMDQLRRRMDRLLDEYEPAHNPAPGLADEVERMWSGRFPHVTVVDQGSSLVLEADLPGLGEKDVQLSIHQDVLALSGERKSDAPQGYYVHRQERAPVKFSRSFTLPCKIDPEKSSATIKNGVLTVTLSKAAEATPRQIAIKAQ
jgi:HSP20 family protein